MGARDGLAYLRVAGPHRKDHRHRKEGDEVKVKVIGFDDRQDQAVDKRLIRKAAKTSTRQVAGLYLNVSGAQAPLFYCEQRTPIS